MIRLKLGGLYVLATVAVSASAVLSDAYGAKTVQVSPEMNVAKLVEASSEGTVFRFAPGIYRRQTVVPKNGQQFIGQPGVIFNGAQILQSWQRQGALWVAQGPKKPLRPHGFCDDRGKLCRNREDLFVDGRLYHRANSLDELARIKWFERKWFYENGQVYLGFDPGGRTVELSVTPHAFVGKASDVVIDGIIVEKYASAAQRGAIEFRDAKGWRLVDVVAQWNHGVGARIGAETKITGGSFSHNGQLGIGGGYGAGIVLDGPEIAFNNYAGYSWRWEAGGTKFVATRGMTIRNTCVHSNFGPGLWTDIDNVDVKIVRNKVFNNRGDGIKHEISYKAEIRENIVARNGHDKDRWLWGSQILVQNSRDVEVSDNVVEVDRTYGNAIGIIQQDRGVGKLGKRISYGNRIRNNVIIFLGQAGHGGIVMDNDDPDFWTEGGNEFNNNTYIVPNESQARFEAKGRLRSWNDFRELGYEASGKLLAQNRAPSQISCSPQTGG